MIPTIERRGEGSPTERGAGWGGTGPCGVVAIEGGAPAGQGLGLALLEGQRGCQISYKGSTLGRGEQGINQSQVTRSFCVSKV